MSPPDTYPRDICLSQTRNDATRPLNPVGPSLRPVEAGFLPAVGFLLLAARLFVDFVLLAARFFAPGFCDQRLHAGLLGVAGTIVEWGAGETHAPLRLRTRESLEAATMLVRRPREMRDELGARGVLAHLIQNPI